MRSIAFSLMCAPLALAQTTTRVDVNTAGMPSNWPAHDPALSGDGRYVAFESAATNLAVGDVDNHYDVYLHDRATGITELVSVSTSGVKGNGSSFACDVSIDGVRVVFVSGATNLTAGDVNGAYDVFVRDRGASTTDCASVDGAGALGNGFSIAPTISSDGRFVAYTSSSSNLVPGDANATWDVFVRDRVAATTECVSVGLGGAPGNGRSGFAFISGGEPATYISGDGRFVVFESEASDLVSGDTNAEPDVFLRDRSSATTIRVSVDSAGNQVVGTSCPLTGYCMKPTISRDGRFVAFNCASDGLVAGDTNGLEDIFVRDLQTGTIERASVDSAGAQANGGSREPSLSDDGRFVAFPSDASNLVAGDTNLFDDVFVRDRTLGVTSNVHVATTGAQGQGTTNWAELSGDASRIVYTSFATNLVAGDISSSQYDVFVHDLGVLAPVTSYCTAKTNSLGCAPVLTSSGAPRASGYDAFFLVGQQVQNQKSGVFFWGAQAASIPFGGGTLCVQPPLVRSSVLSSGGASSGSSCTGNYSFQFRQSYMASKGLGAGDTVFGQFWSRDPGYAPPNNVGLTDAIVFTIAP